MTQRRRGYYDPNLQDKVDRGTVKPPKPDFIFRGGCTLLIDPETAHVRYCIYKRIRSKNRLDRMRRFLVGDASPSLRTTYLGDPRRTYFARLTARHRDLEGSEVEAFALLHRSGDGEEVDR
jgi:hypothetical protein